MFNFFLDNMSSHTPNMYDQNHFSPNMEFQKNLPSQGLQNQNGMPFYGFQNNINAGLGKQYAPPQYQNLPNHSLSDLNQDSKMPPQQNPGGNSQMGVMQELFTNNQNLLAQFNQFLQFMSHQGQGPAQFMNNGMPWNPQMNMPPMMNQPMAQKNMASNEIQLPSQSQLVDVKDELTDRDTRRSLKFEDLGLQTDRDAALQTAGSRTSLDGKIEETQGSRKRWDVSSNSTRTETVNRWEKREITSDLEPLEESNYRSQTPAVNMHDEIIVSGIASKNFEKFLEEKLKSDPNAVKDDQDEYVGAHKKKFLTKGSGKSIVSKGMRDDRPLQTEDKENDDYRVEYSSNRKMSKDKPFRVNNNALN